ncbi:hypothetical protein SBDP1_120029 [Syntrophobacter sp. SbD1]|nr:hypothetical protein SBDP1_120029 [Syntrophobacter sp. SbD1]
MSRTVESKISALMADDRAKAILDRHCPGLRSDPRLQVAMGMTLKQIMPFPDGRIKQI